MTTKTPCAKAQGVFTYILRFVSFFAASRQLQSAAHHGGSGHGCGFFGRRITYPSIPLSIKAILFFLAFSKMRSNANILSFAQKAGRGRSPSLQSPCNRRDFSEPLHRGGRAGFRHGCRCRARQPQRHAECRPQKQQYQDRQGSFFHTVIPVTP